MENQRKCKRKIAASRQRQCIVYTVYTIHNKLQTKDTLLELKGTKDGGLEV